MLVGFNEEAYKQVLGGRPLRVVLVADDALRYEEAAGLIGVCSSAGVTSVRLADPSSRRGAGRRP